MHKDGLIHSVYYVFYKQLCQGSHRLFRVQPKTLLICDQRITQYPLTERQYSLFQYSLYILVPLWCTQTTAERTLTCWITARD